MAEHGGTADGTERGAVERGAVTLEYGLLISLVAAVVAVALTVFGPAVAALLGDGLDVLL